MTMIVTGDFRVEDLIVGSKHYVVGNNGPGDTVVMISHLL
jgi:hypothetical protein